MSRTEDWLPHNHEALFDKATETVNYMTDSNRARMGLGSGMPGGLWYDGTFIPAFGELAGALQHATFIAAETLVTQSE